MSPQSLTISPSPSPILVRHVLSRWTDADLLHVLSHVNGNFEMAIDAILRHEATGQLPADLIRHLRGEIVPQPQLMRNISGSLRSSTHTGSDPIVLDDNVSMCHNHNVSMGTMTHPPSSSPFESERLPPSSSFLRLERMYMQFNTNTLAVQQPDCESRTAIAVPRVNNRGRGSTGEYTGRSRVVSPSLGSSTSTSSMMNSEISRPLGLDAHRKLTQREKDELLLRILSRSRHRQPDADVNASGSMPKTQKRLQRPLPAREREFDMLNMQTSIEASLTRNTTEIDLEDEAVSYAVKVSKETFDAEFKRMELRRALEIEQINKTLVESLTDTVKMSEEELITKAMAESLADPVKKTEEQLIEEARELSLRDPIKRSEEQQLVEEAIRQSLFQEMPGEEDLVEAVKWCQPLASLPTSTGKKPRRWSFTEEDMMFECSVGVADDSPPCALDFSLTSSSFFDCKMPARSLTETQAFGNDAIESFGNADVTLKAPASAEHITGEEDSRAVNDDTLSLSEDLPSLSTDWGSVE